MSYLIQQLKKYNIKTLGLDILAGLSVAIVVIPQGMAYAVLAGLSPVYGLYAATIPLIIYILFASSPSVQIGPMALMSITVFSGISLLAEPGTDEYLHLVLMTSLLAGVLQVLYGKFKLGVISSYLSKPVLHGFMSAAGVIIISSQLKYLFTLNVPRSSSILNVWLSIGSEISNTNIYSLLLGLGGIAIIKLLKKVHPLMPVYIIAAIAGTLVLYYTGLEHKDVPITGSIPQGLPSFSLDFLQLENVVKVLPTAFVVSLICFVGSFAIAKAYEDDSDCTVDADQELVALGLSKILGSFFLAMPTTGSFSRSAVNQQAGAKTGIAEIVTALFVVLTLLFLCSWFYYLPEPILAAIVISSVLSLIKWRQAKKLWFQDRKDFWLLIVTFLATVLLGIVSGLIVGVLLSLLLVVIRSSALKPVELGKIGDTHKYRSFERFEDAQAIPDTLILRYDQDLFFVNAEAFYREAVGFISRNNPKTMILHLGSVQYLDSVGIEQFQNLLQYCKAKDISLKLTHLRAPIRDKFKQIGMYDTISPIHYHNIREAIESI